MTDRIPQLLMADDHLAVVSCMALRLEKEGFKVVATVSHAEAAVAVSQVLMPDMCILDIVMPGADPFTSATKIREQSPQTKVLFLTGFSTDSHIDRAVASGCDGFVSKEEPFDNLVYAIKHVLAGNTYFSPRVSERLTETQGEKPQSRLSGISLRELEVLRYLAQGFGVRKVAESLGISTKTVEKHQQNIQNKLQVKGAIPLALFAIREGLVHA